MADNNPIYYKDLIQKDDSISNLIKELNELIKTIDTLKGKVQDSAKQTKDSLEKVGGANDQQRLLIDKNVQSTEELIAEYRKLITAETQAAATKKDVMAAQREAVNIQRAIVEATRAEEGSYKQLAAQHKILKTYYDQMGKARQGSAEGKQITAQTKAIYEEMNRLQLATGKATLQVGHYERALSSLPGPLGRISSGFQGLSKQIKEISSSGLPMGQKALLGFAAGITAAVTAAKGLFNGLSSAAKTLRDFEQANVNLSTIIGKNVDELTALSESAIQLSRNTRYAAVEITGLQTELAKLGFKQGSILAMQESVANFATAVGANLSEAAAVAGATLRAFQLTSEQTEEALGVLAIATNNSALSFDRIKDSMGYTFPIANAYGLSVRDTAALLGSLANAGFSASTAATSLRAILLGLADDNSKLTKRIGGSVHTFEEIMDALIKLRKEGVNLSEALDMTEKRSVSAFNAFMTGAEQAKELWRSLEDVDGALEDIANKRLDTVEGATTKLKNAWDALVLSFQKSNGAIKNVTLWLRDLVDEINKALFPNQNRMQESQSMYFEQMKENYKNMGKDAAKEFANSYLNASKERLKEANKKADEQGWLTWDFGYGNKIKKEQKAAQAEFDGVKAAYDKFNEYVLNAEDERDKQMAVKDEEHEERAKKLSKEEEARIKKANKARLQDLRDQIEYITREISITEEGTQKILELRRKRVEAERQYELEQNRQKEVGRRENEDIINAQFNRKLDDVEKDFIRKVAEINVKRLQMEQQLIQAEIQITSDSADEMLDLRLANLDKQEKIEIEQNRTKEEHLQQDAKKIEEKYHTKRMREIADFTSKRLKRDLEAENELAQSRFNLEEHSEREIAQFRIDLEIKELQDILRINEQAQDKLTDMEVEAIHNRIELAKKERKKAKYNNLYEVLGINWDEDRRDAMDTTLSSLKDALGEIVDAWKEVADAAVDAANKQVDSAQKVLDAEIEARNNGYANYVETAQKELEVAKKNRQKALREQEKAQKAQIALDAAVQASSLITATANIWKAFTGTGPWGVALAAAATLVMWGSFMASKAKAMQATKKQEYAEGTVELLEGGSHASGHDIDLGTKKDGTRRRAEGGEYFAIINKRNSRKYRSEIPDIINSLNDGTFSDKYQRASERMSGIAINMSGTNLGRLEKDVSAIRRQGEEQRYVDGTGSTVIKYHNLTRRISR